MSRIVFNAMQADPTYDGNGDGHLGLREWGKNLADYFAAHAPAEPQPWFKPAMPPRPTSPDTDELLGEGFTLDERAEFGNWRRDPEWDLDEDKPHFKKACAALREYWRARDRWDEDAKVQLYAQWPYAWAEKQLIERARLHQLGRAECTANTVEELRNGGVASGLGH